MATKAKKERLGQQRDIGKCEIDDFCKKYGLQHRYLSDYQIRINEFIDVYPTNRRYHVISKAGQPWGWYNEVEDLLKAMGIRKL